MNVNTTIDMISPSTSTSQSTSTSNDTGSASEFESMIEKEVSGSDQSSQGTDGNSSTSGQTDKADNNTTTDSVVEDTTDMDNSVATELQLALLAGLYSPVTPVVVQQVEALEPVVLVEGEVVTAVEETPLVEEQSLFMGDSQVFSQLDGENAQQLPEELVSEGESGDTVVPFVLEETPEVVEALPELAMEVSEEVAVETPVVVVETPETVTEEPVVLEEVAEELPEMTETKDVQVDTTTEKPVVTETKEEVQVVDGGEGTKVFDKLESTPIKVGETVNTEEPDMDEQIAKIVAKAHENGDKTVTIQLTPGNLGTVTISLTQTVDGILQVVLQASDSTAANLLNNHADNIAQALFTAGSVVTVEVGEAVTETPDDAQADLADDGSRQDQQQEENQEEEEIPYNDDFLQQLRLGLVQL